MLEAERTGVLLISVLSGVVFLHEFRIVTGSESDKPCISGTSLDGGFTNIEIGCTHIVGNLVVAENEDNYIPQEVLTTLRNVKEITGYLRIQTINSSRINFGNLRVIRGQTLFRVHIEDPEYALLVFDSSIDHLEFPSLQEISKGSVGMFFRKRMCYLESINWQDIMMDESAQFHYFSSQDNETDLYVKESEANGDCAKCDDSCDGNCWEEGRNHCQQLSKVICSSECEGARCFGTGPGKCCHSSCVGGCTGPGRSDCDACRNVYYSGECQESCPPGKFSFGSSCVDKCPAGTVVNEEDNSCLFKCPSNMYPRNGKCKRVIPPAKLCRQPSISDKVHSGNIEKFRNCTILDGSIEIDSSTFSGYMFHKNFTFGQVVEPMAPDKLDILSNIQEITGTVTVWDTNHSQFADLTCLKNLEVVGSGEKADSENAYAIWISSTSLKSLSLRKLRTVYGCVRIAFNSDLCYVDTVNWKAITNRQSNNAIVDNRLESECKLNNQVCNRECFNEGCWGPYLEDCAVSYGTTSWKALLAIACGVVLLLVILVGVGWRCHRNRKADIPATTTHEGVPLVEIQGTTNLPPNLSKLRIIDETKLRKDIVLGRGAFGIVYRGIWMPEDDIKIPVAIKELRGISGITDPRSFVDEAFLMAGIRHDNLLNMLGLCLSTSGMMMVSQLMPLGSLINYLHLNKNEIGSKSMLSWCTQIAKGMEHLETCRIIHRDLAARNVVMESPTSVKITDFGLAKLLNFGAEMYEGRREMLPIRWLAPECLTNLSFSHKSDVWAFGVTAWEILTFGKTPFDGIRLEEIGTRLNRGERLEQPSNCTIDLYLMLIKTWMSDAESRPTFKELVNAFSEMLKDPGRYLVIPNDELRRLPRYTVEDEEMLLRRLVMPQDRPEDLMSVEQYARLDTDGYLRPASGINHQSKYFDDVDVGRLHYPSMYRSVEAWA